MSHYLRSNLAHEPVIESIKERAREYILGLIPIAGLKTERERLAQLFSNVYDEVDEIQKPADSNSGIRDWAIEPCTRIPDYDPHEDVRKVLKLPSTILSGLKKGFGLLSMVFAGTFFGENIINSFEHVRSIETFGILGLFALGYWVYTADTFVHQTLAKELRAGKGQVPERNPSEMVGYGIWNRSLLGTSGLFLAGLFYVLDSLPALPFVGQYFENPADYICKIIVSNIEILYDEDSLIRAIRKLYSELA